MAKQRAAPRVTGLIDGPLGTHSNPEPINPGFFTIERVVVLLTVVAALLAVSSKNACRLHGWGGTNTYAWAALFGAIRRRASRVWRWRRH